jgi:hypothetical protein
MHKTFVALTFVVCALPAAAQSRGPTDKGSILAAGTASFVRSSFEIDDNDETITGITVNPTLLFFVAPRVAVGGQLGISRVSSDNGSGTSWLLGPAARLYFGEASSRTLPYVGLGVSFGGSSSDSDDSNLESSSDIWGLEGIAGLTWMVTRQVGITGEAFFQRTSYENDGPFAASEQKRTDIGIRFGFAAFLFR